jgi:hypothetical protein
MHKQGVIHFLENQEKEVGKRMKCKSQRSETTKGVFEIKVREYDVSRGFETA